jgi:ornithine cyclodeaminase/alanine dehydrogenase-like protein (mu-crystallin family)
MAPLLIISDADVEALVAPEVLRSAMAAALTAWSAGDASVPARIAARAPHGLLGAMPGYAAGLGLAAKLISIFPDNASRARPSHLGVIVVFDEDDGTPMALVAAGALTALRTAAASALAIDLLAPRDATSVAILGAGVTAAAHLAAVVGARPVGAVRIASRTDGRAARLAAGWPGALACTSLEEAVRGAEIVCCCTAARAPVLASEWVSPGATVTSVGSGEELPGDLVARSQVFVEWRGAVTSEPPAGAVELQGIDPSSVTELGELLRDGVPPATAQPTYREGSGICVYKSTGHAIEDIAAAALVLRLAREAGAGQLVEL